MKTEAVEQVAALLAQAGSAHGRYEVAELNGVYDQDWPDWYAAFLVEHGLDELLPRALDVADLARRLKRCDEDHKREQSHEAWPTYYARRLLTDA